MNHEHIEANFKIIYKIKWSICALHVVLYEAQS